MRFRPAVRSGALAGLAAMLALLPRLGAKPLIEWDEAIYAEAAREMLHLGWLVPHWNYAMWFEKPPLGLWLTAAMYRLLGVNEFAARLISAIAGAATVAVTHAWLALRLGRRTAWLGTAVLLCTFGFLHACHRGELDTLLALGCVIAVAGLAEVESSRDAGWYAFWMGSALGAMTKGAAAVVLPLTASVVWALPRPQRRRATREFWIGLALCGAIVLPWHLAMALHFGQRFWSEYLGLHVFARATQQIEGHQTHWWYFATVLLVSMPPFVLLAPAALWSARKDAALRVWAVFAIVVVLFYSAIQTRLPQYVVPVYPALTVVVAAWLGGKLDAWATERRPASWWVGCGAAAAVFSAAMVVFTAQGRTALHRDPQAASAVQQDNRDSIVLLKKLPVSQLGPGPLLLWHAGAISSIATDVFYSGRQVQQVQFAGIPPDEPRYKYRFDPVPLDQVVTAETPQQPRLILLDRTLVPRIPADLRYHLIAAQGSMELGTIAPR